MEDETKEGKSALMKNEMT